MPVVLIGLSVRPAPVAMLVTVPLPPVASVWQVTLPSAAMARMLERTAQLAETRRCKNVVSAATVPLVEIVPPVRPVPAVTLVTVPPVVPQPASKELCTAAGVLRVPVPSEVMPLVSAAPLKPAILRLMMVAYSGGEDRIGERVYVIGHARWRGASRRWMEGVVSCAALLGG